MEAQPLNPSAGFTAVKGTGAKSSPYYDLEAGSSALYPGVTSTENALRWAFVQKVYGIIGAQLTLTAIVGSFFAFSSTARQFVLSSGFFSAVAIFLPLIALIPLYIYRNKHPLNLGLLALWTASISVTVGVVCSMYNGVVVVEALALTAAVVLSLTLYTFQAVKKGADFSVMGPMLFSSLFVLIVWGFIQLLLNPGPISQMLYSLVGALVFSAFIVFDTSLLIQRYSYDEYIWASVNLYLDIINLFLKILELLNRSSN